MNNNKIKPNKCYKNQTLKFEEEVIYYKTVKTDILILQNCNCYKL